MTLASVLLFAACASSPAAPPLATPEPAVSVTSDQLTLSWHLERGPAGLALAYSVRNDRPEPIWLLDQVLYWPPGTGIGLGADRVLVRAGAGEVPVRFVRGWVPPDGFPQFELPPGAREVAPGATVEGRAVVPLPLETWHPNEPAGRPLPGTTRAALRLGWLTSAPADVRRTADGAEVKVPSPAQRADQRWLEGPPLGW